MQIRELTSADAALEVLLILSPLCLLELFGGFLRVVTGLLFRNLNSVTRVWVHGNEWGFLIIVL